MDAGVLELLKALGNLAFQFIRLVGAIYLLKCIIKQLFITASN